MRLVRAQHEDKVVLARLESGSAIVLAEESGHPAADVLNYAARPPGFLRDGDQVEVEIAGLGVLSNPVRAE